MIKARKMNLNEAIEAGKREEQDLRCRALRRREGKGPGKAWSSHGDKHAESDQCVLQTCAGQSASLIAFSFLYKIIMRISIA